MSKGLEELKDLKNAFIGHCRELKCETNYIKVCENKFSKIEKELKERGYFCHLVESLFEECEVGISAEYDEDLRKYVVEFQIDEKYKFHIYCDRKEYLFWREKSGVDDQYTPEDLR